MQEKINQVFQYWNKPPQAFPHYGDIDPAVLRKFNGTHPAIMKNWLNNEAEQNFALNPNYKLTRRDKRIRIKLKIEKMLGVEISKKHYRDLDAK